MNIGPTPKDFLRNLLIERRAGILRLWRVSLNWGTVLAGLLFNRGAIAITLILIARRFTVAEYGQYASSFALASTLVSLTALGLEQWLLTQGRTTPTEIYSLWGNAMRLRLGILLIWLLCMWLLGNFLPLETYPTNILMFASLGIAFESLTQLSFVALHCINRHWQTTVIQSFWASTLLIIVALFPANRVTVSWFAQLRTILSMLAMLITIALVNVRYLIYTSKQISYRSIIKSSSSFIWSELSSIIYIKADITIVGLLLGSTLSGLYAASSNILQITYLFPQALFLSIVPPLSSAYQKNSSELFNRTSLIQLTAQIASGLLIFLTLFLFAPFIVNTLFGEAYAASVPVVRLLSPIALLRSINFGLASILISSQRQAKRAGFQVLSAVFNVIANLIVAKPFGLLGVATVFILSELILAIGYSVSLLPNRKAAPV